MFISYTVTYIHKWLNIHKCNRVTVQIQLGGNMRCYARIKLDEKGQAESYCMLPEGHTGHHSLCANGTDVRCVASKDGLRCSQPIGHFGSHHVVSGAVTVLSWEK